MNETMLGLLIVIGLLVITALLGSATYKGLIARRDTVKKRDQENESLTGQNMPIASEPKYSNVSGKPLGFILLAAGSLLIIAIIASSFDMNEFWPLYAAFWGIVGVALIGGGYDLIKGRRNR